MLEEKTCLAPGDRVYIADYAMVYYPEDAPAIKQENEVTISPD